MAVGIVTPAPEITTAGNCITTIIIVVVAVRILIVLQNKKIDLDGRLNYFVLPFSAAPDVS
jgi:hypothetical protein